MKLVKITLELPLIKRAEIKSICSMKNMSMKEFIDRALTDYIKSFKDPMVFEDYSEKDY